MLLLEQCVAALPEVLLDEKFQRLPARLLCNPFRHVGASSSSFHVRDPALVNEQQTVLHPTVFS